MGNEIFRSVFSWGVEGVGVSGGYMLYICCVFDGRVFSGCLNFLVRDLVFRREERVRTEKTG